MPCASGPHPWPETPQDCWQSSSSPVSPTEFIDRQFWARIVVDEYGTGFTYSSSGSRFKVKRVSSE